MPDFYSREYDSRRSAVPPKRRLRLRRAALIKGHVAGGVARALLPTEKKFGVRCSDVIGLADVESFGNAVNPPGRALDFTIAADGSVVDDHFAGAIRPLGAVLFIV